MKETAFLRLASARRSIRAFQDRPVEREKLELCLEAARLAPSACNAQPWKFVVVDEPGLKQRLAAAVFSGAYAINKHAASAPVLVAVVSQRGSAWAWVGNQVQGTVFLLVDIGISCEHFVLQAAELGLGTCWLGWFDAKAAARLLGVPRGFRVEMLLSLGYPAEAPGPRPRRSLAEMSAFNRYGP
ncbi:MAG: nitroreductase family protein [Elusimicrobia bacterium]|nr:nitroreductase family protein [Elusimicrobiota bacterium]